MATGHLSAPGRRAVKSGGDMVLYMMYAGQQHVNIPWALYTRFPLMGKQLTALMAVQENVRLKEKNLTENLEWNCSI